MTEPVTQCRSCSTHWSDCDVLDGGECAACLRRQVERLRTALMAIASDGPTQLQTMTMLRMIAAQALAAQAAGGGDE